ncbi:MAG: sugar transferase [Fibrobacteria bacterium]|nr:sugar transferase [Fibrobacteria bacterium]
MMSLRALERAALVAADFLGGMLAFVGIFWVRYQSGWIPQSVDPNLSVVHFVTPGVLLSGALMVWFLLNGLYRDWFLESRSSQMGVLLRAVVLAGLALFVLLAGADAVAWGPQGRWDLVFTRSRVVTIGAYSALILFGCGGLRLLVQSIDRSLLRSGRGLEPTLLLGANSQGEHAVKILEQRKVLGLRPVGFVDPDGNRTGREHAGLKILGKYSDLPRIIDATLARHVIICHSTTSHNEILRILSHLEEKPNLTVYLIPDLFDVVSGHLRTGVVHGTDFHVLYQHHLPAWQAGLKRAMDISFSMLILLAALPALLLAMLAIKLDSPGPIFYSQERIGQYGRRFKVFKLRSMRTDAEMAGPQWAGKKDNRITRVGKILRKSRLDEVPQLWCVFNGDMALVGPRPEREFFIDQLRDQVPLYMRRLKMKPGLTGWAQVTLGYDNSIEDVKKKVMADLWYFENMSLGLDIQILVRTIWVVLTGKGAN